MAVLESEGKTWNVDRQGFLEDHNAWDVAFVKAMAPRVGITEKLTAEHWRTIRFIRDKFEATGRCPDVYETCRANELSLRVLKRLFPAGYQRGACKLAGVTYRKSDLKVSWPESAHELQTGSYEGTGYHVDAHGFLLEPAEWNARFAIGKAAELGMTEELSKEHWRLLDFLRRSYETEGRVPTVYETCEQFEIDLWDLERLFPFGYHRGAVKIAGLRVR